MQATLLTFQVQTIEAHMFSIVRFYEMHIGMMTTMVTTNFVNTIERSIKKIHTSVQLYVTNGLWLLKLPQFLLMKYSRGLSEQIRKETRDEAVNRIRHYKKWFLKTVMRSETSNPIIVLPIEHISPRYRDEPPL